MGENVGPGRCARMISASEKRMLVFRYIFASKRFGMCLTDFLKAYNCISVALSVAMGKGPTTIAVRCMCTLVGAMRVCVWLCRPFDPTHFQKSCS